MTKASCHTCVFACWDLCQAMQGFSSGWPSRPVCANHADAPGQLRPTPLGKVCRNYRPKPPTPEGDVKRIPLGGGLYAYVDAADYEWLRRYTWHAYNGGYAARYEKGKLTFMHREIMKPPKGMVVDHIDGSKANNCRFNLRVCTPRENKYNTAKCAGTASRFKGVGYVKKLDKYCAKFHVNDECMWLGLFDDEVEAARAYDHTAVEYRGPFARLNLPEEWPPERIQEVYARRQAGSVERKGGKRRTEDGRQRTAGENKARRSEGKKARRTRTTKQDKGTRRKGRRSKRKTRPAQRRTKSARDAGRRTKVRTKEGKKARGKTTAPPARTSGGRTRVARHTAKSARRR